MPSPSPSWAAAALGAWRSATPFPSAFRAGNVDLAAIEAKKLALRLAVDIRHPSSRAAGVDEGCPTPCGYGGNDEQSPA
jgi:hypothetical protein